VKFLCAIAAALFCIAAPVAAPAQSLDLSLMSALCSDEDTAKLCSSPAPPEVLPDVLTVEAIIEKYGVIVACDLNDVSVIALLVDPDASLPVGSIHPRRESPIAEKAIVTEDEISTDLPSEPATIALPIVTETQLRQNGEVADEVATTGATARNVPATAEVVNDRRIE
jgi:hypothetical protein